MENNNTGALKKGMSPAAVWALAVGSIIGFGCFILPPDFLQKAGPLGFVLGIVIGAAAMLIVGKNISYMVQRYPVAGGQFTYARQLFGTTNGFICGWMLVLGYISLIALNATALPVLAQYIAPTLFKRGYLYSVAGWDVFAPEIALALFFIVLFGFFNLVGGKLSGNLQVGMVFLMIGAVLLVLFGIITSPVSSFENLQPAFADGKSVFGCVFAILAMVPWLFVGFDTVPQSAEEFSFSTKKTFGLIFGAIISGALFYMVITLCTAMVWPWQEMVEAKYTWATGTALDTAIGPVGVAFLAIAICMGIFTGMNGFYVAGSRLMMAMSREKMLPAWFGKVDAKKQIPRNAVLAAMVVALIAPWFGRQVINWIVDMCSCGTIIGYLYTCLAALKLVLKDRKEGKGTLLDLVVAVLGVALSVGILLLLLVPASPGAMGKESLIALVTWCVLGVVFYFTVIRRGAKK